STSWSRTDPLSHEQQEGVSFFQHVDRFRLKVVRNRETLFQILPSSLKNPVQDTRAFLLCQILEYRRVEFVGECIPLFSTRLFRPLDRSETTKDGLVCGEIRHNVGAEVKSKFRGVLPGVHHLGLSLDGATTRDLLEETVVELLPVVQLVHQDHAHAFHGGDVGRDAVRVRLAYERVSLTGCYVFP